MSFSVRAISSTVSAVPQKVKTPQEMAVVNYEHYAMPHFYSLGSMKFRFFGFSIATWVLNQLSILTGAILFTVCKLIGIKQEKAAVGKVAEQVKTEEDRANLRDAMKTLDPKIQNRLVLKLQERGVVV